MKLFRLPPPDTLAGAIKWRCWEEGITVASLGPLVGLKPDSVRARLSKSRGKRALQPLQITKLADHLRIPRATLHRLAATHEGWIIE